MKHSTIAKGNFPTAFASKKKKVNSKKKLKNNLKEKSLADCDYLFIFLTIQVIIATQRPLKEPYFLLFSPVNHKRVLVAPIPFTSEQQLVHQKTQNDDNLTCGRRKG